MWNFWQISYSSAFFMKLIKHLIKKDIIRVLDDLLRALLKVKHAEHTSNFNTHEETFNKMIMKEARQLLVRSNEEESDNQW